MIKLMALASLLAAAVWSGAQAQVLVDTSYPAYYYSSDYVAPVSYVASYSTPVGFAYPYAYSYPFTYYKKR